MSYHSKKEIEQMLDKMFVVIERHTGHPYSVSRKLALFGLGDGVDLSRVVLSKFTTENLIKEIMERVKLSKYVETIDFLEELNKI